MKKFEEFLTEGNYEDIVCRCNDITRGKLLEQSKFMEGATKLEVLKSLMKGGCGCCLKDKGTCPKIDVHYTDVLK